MATYIALLHKDRASDFGVSFPDLPGCVTAGRTLEEARRMAVEALALHVEGMIEDGDALPVPSGLDEVMADPENQGTVVFMVDAPETATRAVRVNITLPENLLQAIDAASNNRSRFLADAARERLKLGASGQDGRQFST